MKVTSKNYQNLAERTSATSDRAGTTRCKNRLSAEDIRLLHGAMGLCTETGELQDALKRWIFYGKDVDRVNIVEECGDLLWYIAEVLNALGLSMENVMQRNIGKLSARYPDKFSELSAIQRDIDAEMAELQK